MSIYSSKRLDELIALHNASTTGIKKHLYEIVADGKQRYEPLDWLANVLVGIASPN